MSVRIYDLAKRLKLSNRDLLALLEKRGIPAKSHSSTLDEETAESIARELAEPARKKAAAPAAPKRKPAARAKKQAPAAAAAEEPPPPPPAPAEPVAPPPPVNKPLPPSPLLRPRPLPPLSPGGRPPAPGTATGTFAAAPSRITVQGQTLRTRPPITVKELAEAISIKPFQLIQALMRRNVFATINETLEVETAKAVAAQFGFSLEIERREKAHHQPQIKQVVQPIQPVTADRTEDLRPRSPVVTFMGHVDHGKTSLLDAIRRANVVATEAGGITQHIGAYTVNVGKQSITFLDTPGHEAFTAMRARGAQVTDIAVLVVAADDGVMPQTVEALNHARAARVPVLVAVNKIDLPAADVLRVRTQLQERGLAPEDWGGETIFVDVSATTGQGIKDLLEMILLQAEMLELKANPNRPGEGTVVEAQLETGPGPTATVLVRNGTLRVGDAFVCGPNWGKVKALLDHQGQRCKAAAPATPVKVVGLSGVPEAGVLFQVVASERAAREIADQRQGEERRGELERPKRVSLEDLYQQIREEGRARLNVVLKADVQGSVEAIVGALSQIPDDKVKLEIAHAGVGNITESDVLLASASDALILGFNVRPDAGAKAKAKHDGVEMRLYQIIYELIEEVREAMQGLLEPEVREAVVGHAEVRQTFSLSRGAGTVAGCVITDGRIQKETKIRVLRDGHKIHEGTIASLRHFQQDVREVRAAQECGIILDKFAAFEPGDILEGYELQKVAQHL